MPVAVDMRGTIQGPSLFHCCSKVRVIFLRTIRSRTLFTAEILAFGLEMLMQALAKATLLAVGLSISGSAMAADDLGGWAAYNAQYAYNPPPYNYGTYPAYTSYYGGY